MFEALEDRRLMSGTALEAPATSGYIEQGDIYATETLGLDSSVERSMESLTKVVHAEFKRG